MTNEQHTEELLAAHLRANPHLCPVGDAEDCPIPGFDHSTLVGHGPHCLRDSTADIIECRCDEGWRLAAIEQAARILLAAIGETADDVPGRARVELLGLRVACHREK